MWKQSPQGVQRYGFSQQVSIGREVIGEIDFEVQAVMIEPCEKPMPERVVETISHKMIDPDPGERAERDFESAGPIDAVLEGVLREPALQLPHDLGEKLLPAGKQISLREQDQMLVAIDLPNAFVVAGAGSVEVGNAAEIQGAGFDAAHIIAAPADIGAGFEGDSEERESMVENVLRYAEALGGERSGFEAVRNLRRIGQSLKPAANMECRLR